MARAWLAVGLVLLAGCDPRDPGLAWERAADTARITSADVRSVPRWIVPDRGGMDLREVAGASRLGRSGFLDDGRVVAFVLEGETDLSIEVYDLQGTPVDAMRIREGVRSDRAILGTSVFLRIRPGYCEDDNPNDPDCNAVPRYHLLDFSTSQHDSGTVHLTDVEILDGFPDGSLLTGKALTRLEPRQGEGFESTVGLFRVPPVAWREPGREGEEMLLAELQVEWLEPGLPFRWGHLPQSAMATTQAGIWIAPTSAPRLVRVGLDGEPELMVEWPSGDRSIPPDALERWRQDQMAALPDTISPARRARRSRSLEQWIAADSFPAATDIITDERGVLYVRGMEMESGSYPRDSSDWMVIGPDGELRGILQVSDALWLHDVSGHRVLASFEEGTGTTLVLMEYR